ncbi:hypothetical protein RHSIM_RhsimUnG0025300 [Rhododendron simsii]|uniref:Uncharacterized protein n=1 Tax=Rhododendron simsii TaxID=118357 RepID=A0A834L5M6_RHOSS|nr:hypothetical protein RHSIM_RhsimUnG0025300 [Rhododendron simsii]
MAASHLPRLLSNHPFSDLTYRSRFLLHDPFAPWASPASSSSPSRSQSSSVSPSPSPESCAKMGFLTSNPSTLSLCFRTTIAEAILKSSGSDDLDNPKLERKTNTTKFANSAVKSPKPLPGSNPSW